MARVEIVRLGDSRDRLGEGLLWDAAAALLYWVDSLGCLIRRIDLAGDQRRDYPLESEVGSLALRRAGGVLVALADGFHFFDPETGITRSAVPVAFDRARLRMNDGKVDRNGAFLAGTMYRSPPPDQVYTGALYRLGPDLSVTVLEEGVGVANGPCFSPDGGTFYFADSPRRVISAYDYDGVSGRISNKRLFVDTEPYKSGPDGATVDAEGFLWTAFVHAGTIGRFAPDGRLDRIIEMPVKHPTNVAFGGPQLDTLFVTSISQAGHFRDDNADAGGLFAVHGLGVQGLEEPRFAG